MNRWLCSVLEDTDATRVLSGKVPKKVENIGNSIECGVKGNDEITTTNTLAITLRLVMYITKGLGTKQAKIDINNISI